MDVKTLYNKLNDVRASGFSGVNAASRYRSLYNEYAISHCYHPIKVNVFNSHTGKYELRTVPCGTCYNCSLTKRNAWVTRMFDHLEDYKYCYFVTLTYKTFQAKHTPFNDYLMYYLRDCGLHFDNINERGTFGYRPTLLCKKHYQDFLKRLRKQTNNKDITYFMCGEYGKKFGSPHFHFILFSKSPISYTDVRRAWSLSLKLSNSGKVVVCRKPSARISLGRVQFDDLVTNGTISKTPALVDGVARDARYCFSYVAKYVAKKECNYSRPMMFIRDLQSSTRFWFDSSLSRYIFSNNGDTLTPIINLSDYDENSSITFPRSLECSFVVSETPFEFVQKFRPFTECSRATPIGSLWLGRHVQEIADGKNIPRPLQEGTTIITPSYYRRKAAQFIHSLRRISEKRCISFGNLPLLLSDFNSILSCETHDLYRVAYNSRSSFDSLDVVKISNYTDDKLNDLLHSSSAFVDVSRRSRFLITLDVFGCLEVREYKYSRSSRSWLEIGSHDLQDWTLHYFTTLHAEFLRYLKTEKYTKETELFYNLVVDFFNESSSSSDDFSVSPSLRDCQLHEPFNDLHSSVIASIEKNNNYFDEIKRINSISNL